MIHIPSLDFAGWSKRTAGRIRRLTAPDVSFGGAQPARLGGGAATSVLELLGEGRAEAVRATGSREEASPVPRRRGLRVLVVEDDPILRRILELGLDSMGFEVEAVENGRIGFQRALAFRPRVIATDIMMPIMSGVQLCRTLRREPGFEGVPFLFFTGYADWIPARDAAGGEGDDYLLKPFDLQDFRARVTTLAERGGRCLEN